MSYTKYLTIPYQHGGSGTVGADCYGLVRLFYRLEYNVILPDLEYELDWYKNNSTLILQEYQKYNFHITTKATEGTILIITEQGLPKHLGVVLDSEYFLHMTINGASIHPYTHGKWANRVFCKLAYKGKPDDYKTT